MPTTPTTCPTWCAEPADDHQERCYSAGTFLESLEADLCLATTDEGRVELQFDGHRMTPQQWDALKAAGDAEWAAAN